jgi:hypothetical protein
VYNKIKIYSYVIERKGAAPAADGRNVEQIYTIPVNEAFDDSRDNPSCGCPLCTLYRRLEENELSLILGASMMEPDVRVETNRLGFCGDHFGKMLRRKNRLGLALMLESHLAEIGNAVFPRGLAAIGKHGRAQKKLSEVEAGCYICSRIEFSLSRMIATVILLWEQDREFREKFSAQPRFCLPHYRRLVEYGAAKLGKRDRAEFLDAAEAVEKRYFESLQEDVSAFCRAFDYRSEGEVSEATKTAVDRSVRFLSGQEGREIKPC